MTGSDMSITKPSYRTVVQRPNEHAIDHRTIVLQDSSLLLVSQRGARVYRPFRSEYDASENWMPNAFNDPDQFSSLINSGHWNVGGERVWIGPEIQYMIPVRSDYWGSYHPPESMDPGVHTLEGDEQECVLTFRSALEGYNLGSGRVDLNIRITIAPAAHPLRFTRAYANGLQTVRFSGYTERVELRWAGGAALLSESWNLAQVRPGGRVLIPATPLAEVTDYYEESSSLVGAISGAVSAEVTGDRRYKVGIKAPHVHGRAGYFRDQSEGEASLLVRSFANDPSSVYSEEPDFSADTLGDSMHVYNDDGGLGGFGEIEARGRTIGGSTGRQASVDEFTSWWFFGTPAKLDQVAQHLLGVGLDITTTRES